MKRVSNRWFWSRVTAGLLALWLAGCVTLPEKIAAVKAVDEVYCKEYAEILKENGSRTVSAPRDRSFAAIRAVLLDLSMNIYREDPAIGFLGVVGDAPLPLSQKEWDTVRDIEVPRLRDIAEKHVGWLVKWFVGLKPEGLQIRITATVLERGAGSEVSLTMRMNDLKPDPDLPRRTCAPPTAVRMGLDKIWARFEQRLQRQQ